MQTKLERLKAAKRQKKQRQKEKQIEKQTNNNINNNKNNNLKRKLIDLQQNEPPNKKIKINVSNANNANNNNTNNNNNNMIHQNVYYNQIHHQHNQLHEIQPQIHQIQSIQQPIQQQIINNRYITPYYYQPQLQIQQPQHHQQQPNNNANNNNNAANNIGWELSLDQSFISPDRYRVLSCTIYVGFWNDVHVDIDKLRQEASEFGPVLKIMPHPTKPPHKHAFVQFNSRNIAENAKSGLRKRFNHLQFVQKVGWGRPPKLVKESFKFDTGIGEILKSEVLHLNNHNNHNNNTNQNDNNNNTNDNNNNNNNNNNFVNIERQNLISNQQQYQQYQHQQHQQHQHHRHTLPPPPPPHIPHVQHTSHISSVIPPGPLPQQHHYNQTLQPHHQFHQY